LSAKRSDPRPTGRARPWRRRLRRRNCRGGPQAPPGNCTLLHGVTARGLAH